MDQLFGDDFNQTAEALVEKIPHKVYSADEIALMLAGLGGCVATIVYSVKNIKHSTCCLGLFSCDQRTELPISKDSIVNQVSVV